VMVMAVVVVVGFGLQNVPFIRGWAGLGRLELHPWG
jgi:hypothetical protein